VVSQDDLIDEDDLAETEIPMVFAKVEAGEEKAIPGSA
jgi:hypothetical protein